MLFGSYPWNAHQPSSVDSSGETEVISLDISKAFSQVRHDGLLGELPMYGLPAKLTAWIGSFPSNTSLSVRLQDAAWDEFETSVRVPPEFVLLPTCDSAVHEQFPSQSVLFSAFLRL